MPLRIQAKSSLLSLNVLLKLFILKVAHFELCLWPTTLKEEGQVELTTWPHSQSHLNQFNCSHALAWSRLARRLYTHWCNSSCVSVAINAPASFLAITNLFCSCINFSCIWIWTSCCCCCADLVLSTHSQSNCIMRFPCGLTHRTSWHVCMESMLNVLGELISCQADRQRDRETEKQRDRQPAKWPPFLANSLMYIVLWPTNWASVASIKSQTIHHEIPFCDYEMTLNLMTSQTFAQFDFSQLQCPPLPLPLPL